MRQAEVAPIAALLNYVKKLAHFNEDKNYAQIPAEAENLDAVRLLTVHSAKGLGISRSLSAISGRRQNSFESKRTNLSESGRNDCGETDFHDDGRRMSVFRGDVAGARFSASFTRQLITANKIQ